MNLVPGTRLGRYEVRALLGTGGMGEVYLAYDRDLEREIAIKVLRDGSGESGDRLRRFEQEAKAASGLHHPNIAHVYEIGSQDNLRFIAMELVQGETLRERLGRGPMPVADVLDLGTQIAAAMSAAHKSGVIHRDIKPENVIIMSDGYAKVLDFGLAKLREIRADDAATLLKTKPGVAMGTISYMAPEQLVGADVTPAADVFSLGVVLYEMLAGHRPFEGATTTEVVSAILSKAPRPLHEVRTDLPPKLETVIGRALAKNVEERYRDASEMYEQLRLISRQGVVVAPVGKSRHRAAAVLIALAVVMIGAIAAGVWKWNQTKRRREAVGMIETAERMVSERKLADAYDTAIAAAAILPNDDRIRDIISRTSDRLKIDSDPPGATVFLQRFKGPDQQIRMGVTPLTIPRLARADYLLTLEKAGYANGVRTISTTPLYNHGEAFARTENVRMKLAEASKMPPGMVLVEGGAYRLAGFDRLSERVVELHDFFIDRCEVSNREFEQFVRDGGYRRRELWKNPFVDHGNTLSFEQAMSRFHDTTGLPGPRNWGGGAPPAGRENHPVGDITWYEAAAFAEWSGKKLPTVYQWEKAARYAEASFASVFPWGYVGEGVDANERANFRGEGTMPVDSLPFGASPYGALNMAGNVSEWCRNPIPPGYAARGGAWKDAVYAFGQTAAFPPFYSAPSIGFRCVRDSGGDEGDFALNPSDSVPVYKSVDDRTYAEYARRYEYRAEPLNARVVERIETLDWTREKITFTASGKTVPAYLYLPKGFRRPLQVIQYAPAGDVVRGYRTLPHSIEVWLAPIIRTGRAIFSVELEGFLGRPHPLDWVEPDPAQDEYVDYNVQRVTEMRRGLDYLESRPDIDHSRIALYGLSAGGGPGVFVTALDQRYRAVMFSGTGIGHHETRYAGAANRINFVSHIRAPKLLLDGRFDEDTPLQSETVPMFRLLREPKHLQIFEGAHVPPTEILVPTLTKWFDETMGAVEH
jgi:formylglycine-generating enzyme required for sulfatase activity/dienelactone hydrolase/predicted Ser/Thr protein kinase